MGLHNCGTKAMAAGMMNNPMAGLSSGVSSGQTLRGPNTRLQDAADGFMDEANRLRSLIDGLQGRLSPILLPDRPSEPALSGSTDKEPPMSEHRYTLACHRATIRNAADQLESILDRLDI